MIIVHVDTGSSWRGGQNQVLLLAKGQQRRNHDPHICCPKGSPLASRAEAWGIPVWPFPGHRISPAAVLSLRRVMATLAPDIIHSHTAHALTLTALAAWRKLSVPHVHARRVDFPLNGFCSKLKYTYAADRIIAISHQIAAVLIKDGVQPDRITVIHSGVDPEAVRSQVGVSAVRSELGLQSDSILIATVAELTDHKGHRYLIEAAKTVIQDQSLAHFLFIGAGELAAELQALVQQYGLPEHIHFLGFRPNVPTLLHECSLFVLPSHLEGLGTSLLDAMSLGLPIVATNVGGIPEAVTDGVNGLLVPARNPAALAEAIVKLLQSPELRKAYGAAGQQAVAIAFHIDRTVEQTLLLYETLDRKSQGGVANS